MNTITRLRRYVALQTYEMRQAWRHFRQEATELWQYWSFSRRHKVDGKKDDSSVLATVFALIPEFNQVRVESSNRHQYAITPKTAGIDFDKLQVGQRLHLTVDQRGGVLHAALLGDNKDVLYLPANSGVFDPKNDHLFTAEAAHKAFEHLKDTDDKFEQLKAREERRLNKIMWWSGSLSLLCAVVLAVLLFKT